MMDFWGFPTTFWERVILVSFSSVNRVSKPQYLREYSLSFHYCAILPLLNANVFCVDVSRPSKFPFFYLWPCHITTMYPILVRIYCKPYCSRWNCLSNWIFALWVKIVLSHPHWFSQMLIGEIEFFVFWGPCGTSIVMPFGTLTET